MSSGQNGDTPQTALLCRVKAGKVKKAAGCRPNCHHSTISKTADQRLDASRSFLGGGALACIDGIANVSLMVQLGFKFHEGNNRTYYVYHHVSRLAPE